MQCMTTLPEDQTNLDDPKADNVDHLWVAESRRRYQAYSKGEIEARPGDQVMTRGMQSAQKISDRITGWA